MQFQIRSCSIVEGERIDNRSFWRKVWDEIIGQKHIWTYHIKHAYIYADTKGLEETMLVVLPNGYCLYIRSLDEDGFQFRPIGSPGITMEFIQYLRGLKDCTAGGYLSINTKSLTPNV